MSIVSKLAKEIRAINNGPGVSIRNKFIVVLVAMVAWACIMHSTRSGPGVSPDSIQYLYAAQTFLHGDGFLSIYEDQGAGPLTHYPPGFSMMIAATSLPFHGNKFVEGGRWLNIFLWGASIAMIAAMMLRTTKRKWVSIVVVFIAMTNIEFLRIYEMVWSEPAYFLLCTLALWMLAMYLRYGRSQQLILTMILIAIASMTRYVGIVLLFTFAATMLFRSRRSPLTSILLSGLTALPLAAWLIRGRLVAGNMTNREFSFHPMDWEAYREFFSWTGAFVFQVPSESIVTLVIGIVVCSLFVAFVVTFWKVIMQFLQEHPFAALLTFYNLAYLLFLAFSNTFLDHTPLYYRTLYPSWVHVVMVLGMIYHWGSPILKMHPRVRGAVITAGGVLLFVNSNAFLNYLKNKDTPTGYFHNELAQSATIEWLQNAPGTRIFTNGIDICYAYTGVVHKPLGKAEAIDPAARAIVFKWGAFNNGRSWEEDLTVHFPYTDGLELTLEEEDEMGRIFKIGPAK